jgi:hypothetical protein
MLETVPRRSKADPPREPTDPLSLRVPKTLLAALREAAFREDRNLNAQVVRVLREWVEKQKS